MIHDLRFTDHAPTYWIAAISESQSEATLLDIALSVHKGAAIRETIEAAGAELRFLPPYSPDFNPIEQAFAKLKALMRKAAARTKEVLWSKVGEVLDAFTPGECENYFTAAGYEPE